MFKHLLFSVNNSGIATLTINRPDKLNALNTEVLAELDSAISDIEQDAEIRALIITGAGEKAFIAGADIKELSGLDEKTGFDVSKNGQRIFQSIEDLNIPVVAAVNGYALGGGAELAMACHIRIASSNAVLGLPEVSLGLIPGYGGTQRLARIVGKAKATELILSGNFVNADEALALGLVNRVVDDNLLPAVDEMLKGILKNGPLALKAALQAIRESDSPNGYDAEVRLFSQLCTTKDFIEGTGAFLEKRKPTFRGK